MKIINKVINCKTLQWEKLKNYEFNNLKDNARNITKLKNSIVNSGFNSPFYIWHEHKYVIDGMGRNLALLELEEEGYIIPDMPVVEIKAETKKEALKIVLQVSSQHGKITQSSLSDFASIDFDLDELKDLQLKELNLSGLDYMMETLEEDINFDNIKSNADRETKEKMQLVTCPACDCKFNIQV
jgi:hypothetical protein